MLSKALASIEEQSVDERFLYGRTMTVRQQDLQKFEEITEEYLQRLADFSSVENCDSVYQVNVQIFNLKAKKGVRDAKS